MPPAQTPDREKPSVFEAKLRAARVALVTNFIDPQKAGSFESLGEKLGDLTIFISTEREGHRIWAPATGRLKTVLQKTITIKSSWRHPMGFKDVNYLHFPVDTYSQLRRYRPDVVLSSQLGLRTVLACAFRITHPRSRLIVWVQMTEHQQSGRRTVRTLVRKLIARCADAAVANGHSAKRYMVSLGFPPDGVSLALGSIDMQPYLGVPDKQPSPHPRRFLYVGRLVEGKGLLPFLSRLSVFAGQNPGCRLVFEIVGYGPVEKEVLRAEHPSNLEVRCSGTAMSEALPRVYASADVFVLPTLSDEWGMVVNEAMASGLPVLGSVYSQAVEELVEDGVSGWTFAPDRQNEVDTAIARAANASDSEILVMGRKARLAVRRCEPERWVESVLGSLGSVL
jgi:glycosyltransferase involved in cell wall biosynthesis